MFDTAVVIVWIVGFICLFVNLRKVFAWLLYDTKIEATCDGCEGAGNKSVSFTSYFSYSYKDQGYAVGLKSPFKTIGKKYKIKIRSDKPWKAVSFFEFIFGIFASLVILYFVWYLTKGLLLI